MARSSNIPPYPLNFVPHEAREKIAKVFDPESLTGIAMENLAEKLDTFMNHSLGFDPSTLRQMRNSSFPTLTMLCEAEKRRVTADMLQRAIEELGAAGHDVLPEYLPVIHARYEAYIRNIPETGTPGPSPCLCQECLSQNFHHQDRSYPSDITIQAPTSHQNIHPSYHLPQVSVHPTNHGSLWHGGCHDPRCAHTSPIRQRSARNTRQRQLSSEDNNRQSLQSSQTDNSGLYEQISSRHIQPNNNNNSTHRPASCHLQRSTSNIGMEATQANAFSSCDCKDCEQRRLSSDWEETEHKSSSTSYVQTTSNNWSSGSPETPIPNASQDTHRNNVFHHRSNSVGLSSASDASRQGSKRSGGSDSDITKIHPECTCVHYTNIPVRRKKYGVIFVSLAEHSNGHIKEVVNLCQSLHEIGFDIKCDMMDDLFKGRDLNCHEWIDTWFRKARYVLFCISPKYHEYISVGTEEEMRNQRDSAEPNNNRFHTRYIFDRARSEYINNHSMNYRFIPVIFQNAGASLRHVPEFLHATLWYTYPDARTSLANFLLNRKS